MQPWKISAGLTAALAGSAILLAGSRLEYLTLFWPLILADYGVTVVLHMGLAFAAVAAAIYGIAVPPGLPTWDAGSISSSAPSGAAKAIPSSPALSRETPRAIGTNDWEGPA